MSEGQRQAMDFTSLVWFIGISLAFQRHTDGQLMALKAKHNGQGAEKTWNPSIPSAPNYDVEVEQYCHLKWKIAEELCAQQIFIALPQEFGTKKTDKNFSQVFFKVFYPSRTKKLQKQGVLAHYKALLGQLWVMMLGARMLPPRWVDNQKSHRH